MSSIPLAGRSLVLLAVALVAAAPRAQTLDLVGTVTFPVSASDTGGSDVWPYTAPDGAEYALMGVLGGVAVVAVPSLEVVTTIAGPTEDDFYYHRDIKTRGDYAFIVSECYGQSEGLQVVDLSGLPESVEEVAVLGGAVVSSHNLSVDVPTGYAYVLNSAGNNLQIVDVRDPAAPAIVGTVPTGEIHDVYARNDTLWVAHGNQHRFSMWDVSDKAAPVQIAQWEPASLGYAHNIWPTDDGRYALTTEETADRTVKVWDLTDPTDATLVGEYLGPSRLAHNAHVRGRYAYVSHYESGVVVLDLADLSDPVEVARYDTYQGESPAFHGTWGTAPVSPGGYIYGSDLEGKLTVLRVTENPTAAEAAAPAPTSILDAVYPNPARGTATVRFTLAAPGAVRLVVLDALGREVARLVDGAQAAGTHAVIFDGTGLPAGRYLVQLDAGGHTEARRFSLVR